PGGGGRGRDHDRVRSAGDRDGLDRARRPAQHGRRPARLRPAGGQVLPPPPAGRRAGHGRHRRGRKPRGADRARRRGGPGGGPPPYAPVTLGALAGRPLEPVRYSPMQPWHEAHGAWPLIAGAWIRPDHYGDPAAEVRNVRSNVGIIDVTPIGKLDLRGPDVPRLLNLVYVNKWSKLGLGRVRYGVMCAEDGVVVDDGVTGHLGPDHYLMSTTSSGAAAVWQSLENVL